MKTYIVKPEIGRFCSAIHYKEGDSFSENIQYLGSKTNITNQEFAEYDFSYFINKYKFNSSDLLSFADSNLINKAGNYVDNVEVLNKLVFPTSINSKEDLVGYDFFGSLNIKGTETTLYVIYAGEGVKRIELFEDVVDKKSNPQFNLDKLDDPNFDSSIGTIPAVVLELGPEPDKIYGDEFEKALLEDEISCSKVIWITTSFNNGSTNYNLSYGIWLIDKNSQRNKPEYSLRNDEYYSSVNYIKVIDRDDDLYYDKTTNTVVGNVREKATVDKFPLLNLIKHNSDKYSAKISYKRGDEVLIGENTYQSLIDNNLGNVPYLSSSWKIINKSSDFLTTRLDIITDPLNTAEITPNKISVNNNKNDYYRSGSSIFNIVPVPGYEVAFDFNNLTSEENECISNGVDFSATPDSITKNSINDYIAVYTLGLGTQNVPWSEFTKADSGKAIIKMRKRDTVLKFIVKDEQNNIFLKKDWQAYFKNETDFGIKGIYSDGYSNLNVTVREDSTVPVPVNNESEIKVVLGKLRRYEIDSITLNYHNGFEELSREIPVQIDESGNYYFIDNVDYLYAEYVLNASVMTYSIQIIGDLKYYEVEDVYFDSDYNKEFNARFYCAENNPEKKFYGVLIYREGYSSIPAASLYSVGSRATIGTGENQITVELFYNEEDEVYTVHGDRTCENYVIDIIKEMPRK